MMYTNAISNELVNAFEDHCPQLRMTKKEREELHKLFTECQLRTWDSLCRTLSSSKPK